jgi:hypothetical protein
MKFFSNKCHLKKIIFKARIKKIIRNVHKMFLKQELKMKIFQNQAHFIIKRRKVFTHIIMAPNFCEK